MILFVDGGIAYVDDEGLYLAKGRSRIRVQVDRSSSECEIFFSAKCLFLLDVFNNVEHFIIPAHCLEHPEARGIYRPQGIYTARAMSKMMLTAIHKP